MPRLFVAVDLPETTSTALQALQDEQLSARWTPASQYHLTLRFIGGVDQETARRLEHTVGRIKAPVLHLEACEGMTVFPSLRKPRVLVVRLRASEALSRLQADVEQAAQAAGLEPEARPFTPHITVARLKRTRPQDVRTYLRTHRTFVLDSFPAETFHLYASTLHPDGARHERLATFPLGL